MYDGSAFIIQLPALIKAKTEGGKRLVEVQASSEDMDSEGDIILQRALMDSADEFIESGHIDLNHYSELGHRMGISNPSSYIIGRPTDVKDYGNGRTGVEWEVRKSADGKHDPVANRYDEFWDSLHTKPPVKWSASIYGFPKPGMMDDCRTDSCSRAAKRYLVRGINWRSLAMTTNPVNTSLTKFARVVTAKAFSAILKAGPGSPLIPVTTIGLDGTFPPDTPPQPNHTAPVFPFAPPPAGVFAAEDVMAGETGPAQPGFMYVPHNLEGAIGQYHRHIKNDCPIAAGVKSWTAFKDHFMACCGAPADHAEMVGRALMHWLLTDAKRSGH